MNYRRLLRSAGRWTYLGRLEEEMNRRRLDEVPREEIRLEQLRRLNNLWHHAVTHVPHYRDLRQRLSLPGRFASLEEFFVRVPPVSKPEVQVAPRRFLAENAGPGFWSKTGGSTGRPLWSFRGRAAHQRVRMDTHYHRFRHGVAWDDPWLLLWSGEGFLQGGVRGFVNRAKLRVTDRMKNRRRVNAYDLDDTRLESCYRTMVRHDVRLLYGYAQATFRLAHFMRRYPRIPTLDLVVVSAEASDPEEIRFMQQVFGCPVAQEYGAVEMGVIAADFPGAPMRVMEYTMLVETVPHEAGLFEILCTNLYNRDFPLIRYRMEDLTSSGLHVPPVGPAALENVIGRRNDMIHIPPDRWIHSTSLLKAVRISPGVLRLQVVVEDKNQVVIRLETESPLPECERKRMRARIFRILGDATEITIVENVPFETTPRGKHRFVIHREKANWKSHSVDGSVL